MSVLQREVLNDKLLTAAEVAEILSVSPQFVLDHSNGKCQPVIHRVKLGGAVRFRRQDVDAFISMCCSALQDVGGARRC